MEIVYNGQKDSRNFKDVIGATIGQLLKAEQNLDREALITRALENIEKFKLEYSDAPLL